MAFAKLKALLRAAAARTIPHLWQASQTPYAASPRKKSQTIWPPQVTMQYERKVL
jgi:hypothetical protein